MSTARVKIRPRCWRGLGGVRRTLRSWAKLPGYRHPMYPPAYAPPFTRRQVGLIAWCIGEALPELVPRDVALRVMEAARRELLAPPAAEAPRADA